MAGPDPGFSVVGGSWTHFGAGGGGVGLQREHFSVKMYAKTKELGPVGGRAPARSPLDPPMRGITHSIIQHNLLCNFINLMFITPPFCKATSLLRPIFVENFSGRSKQVLLYENTSQIFQFVQASAEITYVALR